MYSEFQLVFPIGWEEKLFKGHDELRVIIPKIKAICRDEENLLLKKKSFSGRIVYTQNIDTPIGNHRLIFELVQNGGTHIFCLRNIAFNHDYHKALQWTPLNAKEITAIAEQVIINKGVTLEINDAAEPAEFRPSHWSILTTPQRAVLEAPTPLLVSGPPGSGKTLVSMSLLQQAAIRHEAGGQGLLKILFITNAENLKNKFQQEWQAWAKENVPQVKIRVFCFTFNEFMPWCIQEFINKKSALSEKDTLSFIESRLRSSSGLTPLVVLREFYLASYALNSDVREKKKFMDSDYRRLGERQSYVSLTQKETVFNLYHQYRDTLTAGQQDCAELCDLREIDTARLEECAFDLGIVDEAQKAGTQQLCNVLRVVKDNNVVYCGDSRQGGDEAVSPLPLLPIILHSLSIDLTINLLNESHRMPFDVARLCNDLGLLGDNLREGIPDKTAYSTFIASPPVQEASQATTAIERSLHWIGRYDESYKKLGRDANAAVIILSPDDHDAAIQHFNSNSVFTYQEAGGLEFDRVVVFISETTLNGFKAINKAMREKGIVAETLLKTYTNLPSQKDSAVIGHEHLQLLSQLFIALSRTQVKAWIYLENHEKKSHELQQLLDWLIARCTSNDQAMAKESSEHEWLHTINTFILNGNTQQAIANLQSNCSLTKDSAEKYIAFVKPGRTADDDMNYLQQLQQAQLQIEHAVTARANAPRQLVASKAIDIDTTASASSQIIASIPPKQLKASSAKKKSAEPPAYLQGLDAERTRKNLSSLMPVLLSEPQPEHWLCKHRLMDGTTLFETIFEDRRSSLTLFLFLKNDKKLQDIFFKAIKPFFDTPLQGMDGSQKRKQATTHFQLLIIRWSSYTLEDFWHHIQDGINEKSLNQEIVLGDLAEGRSILYCLLSNEKTALLVLRQHYKFISEDGLSRIIKIDGPDNGISPLFQLCSSELGLKTMSNHMNFFKKKISTASLHQPVTGPGEKQGMTPFFMLCCKDKIRQLLTPLVTNRKFFAERITVESLLRPVTGEGPKQGITPFFILCDTADGHQLLLSYWDLFAKHITAKDLHRPIIGVGPGQGGTPFFVLCCKAEGCQLLITHWEFFAKRITAEDLLRPLTAEGPDQGKTPFYVLCTTDEGRQLLLTEWEFFAKHITAKALHQPVTGVGPHQGTTPFYFLCNSAKGCQHLITHWTFFAERITAEDLHRPVTGVVDQGKTPFHLLCGTDEGRQLLLTDWNFFKGKIADVIVPLGIDMTGDPQQIIQLYFKTQNETPLAVKIIKDNNHLESKGDVGEQADISAASTQKSGAVIPGISFFQPIDAISNSTAGDVAKAVVREQGTPPV